MSCKKVKYESKCRQLSTMPSSYQKVLSGKRVSLPESFYNKYDIGEGDIVILEEDKGSLRITPANVVPKK